MFSFLRCDGGIARRNQTKVGLKLLLCSLVRLVLMQKKSDQGGIEIDHAERRDAGFGGEEIRPRWD